MPIALPITVFLLLAAFNLYMLRDAVVNGPLWYRDYGLGGMQYGARQVFAEIQTYLAMAPQAQVRLSSAWANGTNDLLRFFMSDDPRVRLETLDGYAYQRQPLTDDYLFIMLAPEYERLVASPKFAGVRVERVTAYPDGSAGFLWVRFAYSSDADALFAAERAARQQPVTEILTIAGQPVAVVYSRLDAGRIQDVFDRDAFTLGRTEDANPAIVELYFPTPRAMSGVTVTVGSMDLRLTAHLYASAGDAKASTYQGTYTGLPADPTVYLPFGAPSPATRLRLEIEDIRNAGSGKIHIREIEIGN